MSELRSCGAQAFSSPNAHSHKFQPFIYLTNSYYSNLYPVLIAEIHLLSKFICIAWALKGNSIIVSQYQSGDNFEMDEKQAIGKKGWKWDWRARKLHVLTPSYHICIFVFVFVEMRLVGGGEITWHCVLTPSYAHFLQDLWPDSHYITPKYKCKYKNPLLLHFLLQLWPDCHYIKVS